jgi:hypothetical protein
VSPRRSIPSKRRATGCSRNFRADDCFERVDVMGDKLNKLLFDKPDHALIRIVNDALSADRRGQFARRVYFPYLHPHGIKEMTETRGLRAAYAVAQLLSSLEVGGVDDRIEALRSLRHEVIDTAEGPLAKNTARVLLQIMKDLVRAHGDYRQQLELAHDFRRTASGKPRIVRQQLRHYHLLEMPEEWNQIAFDDHVHDANTKGRKSSTHLIMDAWIKGIRRLRVIHYNYIEPRFAAELLEAARILEIDIRIGIEFSSRYRNKYAQLIWVPRGFTDAQSFLCFLAEPPVIKLMEAGRSASLHQQQYVMDLLSKFNDVHRPALNRQLGVDLAPIKPDEFLAFVGIGQKSKLHLAKFIHTELLNALQKRLAQMSSELARADAARRDQITQWVQQTNAMDLELLVDGYLEPENNPEIQNPDIPAEGSDVPELLQLSPCELLSRLAQLHSGYRVTLNLTNLRVEEVLELVYDCQGMITRLEIFNLKDYAAGKTAHIADISTLMQAINEGSAIHLKQVIREIIDRLNHDAAGKRQVLVDKLTAILHDIDTLKSFYSGRSLKARIGSDSTGRSSRVHGMGLVIRETLPKRARRAIERDRQQDVREIIPIQMIANKVMRFISKKRRMPSRQIRYWLTAMLSSNGWLGMTCRQAWEVDPAATRMANPGNIVTLGGAQKTIDNHLRLNPPKAAARRSRLRWRYMNSHLQNAIKVIIGFIPAFLTFALTKDWWLLAYCGAFIWFGITGLRNIVQSVLGGGGIKRSPLLHWNDYISWTRITDSLLFTGFSVPLLDYLVKTLILDRLFGINAGTQPELLYTFMALANGIYLSSHNILRGLPRGAVYGNFFRSVLSIPIAIGFNMVIGSILAAAGVAAVTAVLQNWAAIISKAASDVVAGIIEGLADRHKNIQARLREYTTKFAQLFDIYAQLELLYPEVQTFKILDYSADPGYRVSPEARDLEKIIMVHALDLLYFWMYQPRARMALRQFLVTLTEDERHILVSSQFTLQRHREISQLFIDGILGYNFQRPLSFYLSRYEGYLEEVKRLIFDAQPTDSVETSEAGLRNNTFGPAPVKDTCQTPARRVAN